MNKLKKLRGKLKGEIKKINKIVLFYCKLT